jgi:hypothetical protein
VFQPGVRPSVQAREQLARCIAALADCCHVADSSSSELLKRVQQELALLPVAAVVPGGLLRQDPGQPRQLYHQARRYQHSTST